VHPCSRSRPRGRDEQMAPFRQTARFPGRDAQSGQETVPRGPDRPGSRHESG